MVSTGMSDGKKGGCYQKGAPLARPILPYLLRKYSFITLESLWDNLPSKGATDLTAIDQRI